MSLPSSAKGPVRKPRADLYTALLALALVALIVACIIVYLEVRDYGDSPYQGGPSVYAAPGNVDAIALTRSWEANGQRPTAKDEAWIPVWPI